MSTAVAQSKIRTTAWIRWAAGIGILVLVNFISVAYYFGSVEQRVEQNERRITRTEQVAEHSATKEQIVEIKDDLKEVKRDIKELVKQGK